MPNNTATHPMLPQGDKHDSHSAHPDRITVGTPAVAPAHGPSCHGEDRPSPDVLSKSPNKKHTHVRRGLSAQVPAVHLHDAIWTRTLVLANRFRVIRTIDVAAHCFAERPFKNSLTAAQRAMRGMVKAKLLARYRTSRFMTVYGVSSYGAAWLQEAGFDGSSSVRRVSDMTNPEHRLWLQLLVVACESRGLRALTESEVLRALKQATKPGQTMPQGLLAVAWTRREKTTRQNLRPDALAYEADGATWFEADISKRGAGREAALAALATSVGRQLALDVPLRRVVVLCKSERIRKRALAVVRGVATEENTKVLVGDRAHLREAEEGVFEVWRAVEERLPDGRTRAVDRCMGHVIVQALPTWLPKLRVEDAREPITGWFSDGLLPYRRPDSLTAWPACTSPLLQPMTRPSKAESSRTETDRTGDE